MAQEKITFEQFVETVEPAQKAFVEEFHAYLLERGCKVAFQEKKSGFLASYKYGKPPRALLNFLFRKQGMLVRIYGENIAAYPDLLGALPPEMVEAIAQSGDCGRLVKNTCSPKCIGYDFMVGGAHFQKCRYNCFEFLVCEAHNGYIRAFAERELDARQG